MLVGGLLGIATNANKLLPTYEYAGYTMRGGSELTHDEHNQTGDGLKLDYATAWSYGIEETPNLLIPNFNGGSSSGELSRDSETFKVLQSYGVNAESMRKGMPLYWGPQPFTAGPMYLGAVSLFLFVFGLCVIRGRYKWGYGAAYGHTRGQCRAVRQGAAARQEGQERSADGTRSYGRYLLAVRSLPGPGG